MVDKKFTSGGEQLQEGEIIKATWDDGHTAVGKYLGQKQGYIILLGDDGKDIVCNPIYVKFEKVNAK